MKKKICDEYGRDMVRTFYAWKCLLMNRMVESLNSSKGQREISKLHGVTLPSPRC